MYIGRFAPSPTGNLHFGSLLAALASYLDAKKNNGLWLLRIDDLDPPREQKGSTQHIIETLRDYGLNWDGDIVYQSQCYGFYEAALDKLHRDNLCYQCRCSRKEIIQRNQSPLYDGFCFERPTTKTNQDYSWRFRFPNQSIDWLDGIQGQQNFLKHELQDFILKRKDKLWAYQLAVAVDDARMGVTHVVRGFDLLPESANQIALINTLNFSNITFSHIPIIKNNDGQKLSKQNLAKPITKDKVNANLLLALQLLGQSIDARKTYTHKEQILQDAISNWDLMKIPLEYSSYSK